VNRDGLFATVISHGALKVVESGSGMTPLTACHCGGPAFCRAARQRETADQATVEYQPATDVPGHFRLVHLYLLAEMGSPMMEIA
jgi:hypothetical protein